MDGARLPHGLPFRHEALLYEGTDGLVAGALHFIHAGLDAGEPVLVAAREESLEPVRTALGTAAERVEFERIADNPARIIPFWRAFVDAHDGPVRGIGEPIHPHRDAAALVECQLHEALLNVAFEDDFTLLCPYDTTALTDTVIHEARRSHPVVDAAPSGVFRDAPLPLAPLPPPPSGAHVLGFDLGSLHDVRRFVASHGGEPDFVLVVDELAANSIRHGGGRGVVRLWTDDGSMVCDVRDRGSIENPLAWRQRPPEEACGGRGLWIANSICDLVQIRPGAVRVRIASPRPPA